MPHSSPRMAERSERLQSYGSPLWPGCSVEKFPPRSLNAAAGSRVAARPVEPIRRLKPSVIGKPQPLALFDAGSPGAKMARVHWCFFSGRRFEAVHCGRHARPARRRSPKRRPSKPLSHAARRNIAPPKVRPISVADGVFDILGELGRLGLVRSRVSPGFRLQQFGPLLLGDDDAE